MVRYQSKHREPLFKGLSLSYGVSSIAAAPLIATLNRHRNKAVPLKSKLDIVPTFGSTMFPYKPA
jgi:hypothetical protein